MARGCRHSEATSPSRTARSSKSARSPARPTRTVDADGLAVSPGFIDNHCHYDAQVTWDPLCTFSPQHGATTVIFGNCSLSLAPVRRGNEERMAEFLSYVEAIPMEVLRTVDVNWETLPAIHGPARQEPRRQCRHADRPHRGALLRDGRGLPEARRHRRRNQDDAGAGARRHAGRRDRLLRFAAEGALRSAGRADPGAVGRREGDLRARRRAARAWHRHHADGRRRRCGTQRRADGAAGGSHRAAGDLQQPQPDRAQSRTSGSSTSPGSRKPRRPASAPIRCAARTG